MRLHRLTLTNYRGITHRDIEFPDHGIVVVSGPNETGKSSMLEALDLLLEAKDRSTKKEVKQVKPTHADVGAEVTADISTGPYRFVYRKRFHKRPETELTVLTPRREQHTGDEAHERVRAILAETMDVELWQAQRVLQSASTSAVDLSGCDALSRALDVVAGEVDEEPTVTGSAETLLVDRIDAEYRRYFTATGRPTGEWAAASSRLRACDEEAARCAAAVAEVDEAVRRHAALTAQLAAVNTEKGRAAEELAQAQSAAQQIAALRQEVERAGVLATSAADTAAHSGSALQQRRRCRADVEERVAAIADLQVAAESAAEEHDTAIEMNVTAEATAEQARVALENAQQRLDAAHAAVQLVTDRETLSRLLGRLSALEDHQRALDAAVRELGTIQLTDALMTVIDDAAAAVEQAAAAAERASAHLEVLAAADVELRIAGQPVTLRAGDSWESAITAATGVDVAGLLSVRVVPGAPAASSQAELGAATAVLQEALERAGAADVDQARALQQRRAELLATVKEHTAILQALTAEGDAELVRGQVAELRTRLAAGDSAMPAEAVPPAQLRAQLAAEVAAHQQARAKCETQRKVAAETAKLVSERALRAARAKEKLQSARDELAVAEQRLAAQRAETNDEDLAIKADADALAAQAASQAAARLRDELAGHQPDAVATELERAQRAHTAASGRHSETAEALREVAAALKVYGSEGRRSALDAAEGERQHAESEYQRVHRRARAAQLLKTVMSRHRDATRMRYVDPYRGEVERLGRLVFGESFEVDVDSDLRIGARTLSGRTVPYESLSGGAKEQLGIVARLAGASMVATQDSVPVVIDDALGFTDPDRLAKMAEVFDAVAHDGQVIILTCSPQRYADIRSACHIELAGSL
ncbi:ATP-binding protein [Mycobacterium sp. SMC-4]|uniref:ATP-binding protein n=1 Tax=Mycobacterium sp. SMC-4 TaxID=2857059 RepID=UPI0021B2B76F|nr:AAA family ATPase [Mycobacterium sp. SMC-4]UXA16782.1 AAA family ATPase [Mycobacterium sp. SMC-4]